MAPNFIAKHLKPCAGSLVHELNCGHIVQASVFSHGSSSECSPNCKGANPNTTVLPGFLCAHCYKEHFISEYEDLTSEYRRATYKSMIEAEGLRPCSAVVEKEG